MTLSVRARYCCNPYVTCQNKVDFCGIIFDCDGVLFDSKEANISYYNSIREMLAMPAISAAEEEYVHSHSVYQSIQHIVPDDRLEEAMQARKKINYKDLLGKMHQEPGLLELLVYLKEKGVHCAINTNRTTTMDLVLERFGLTQFFSPVITAGKMSNPKPHPEGMFMILQQWRYRPQDVVYIGDSEVDQKTARNSGITFWAYKNPKLQAEMYVPDFWTLRQTLRA